MLSLHAIGLNQILVRLDLKGDTSILSSREWLIIVVVARDTKRIRTCDVSADESQVCRAWTAILMKYSPHPYLNVIFIAKIVSCTSRQVHNHCRLRGRRHVLHNSDEFRLSIIINSFKFLLILISIVIVLLIIGKLHVTIVTLQKLYFNMRFNGCKRCPNP